MFGKAAGSLPLETKAAALALWKTLERSDKITKRIVYFSKEPNFPLFDYFDAKYRVLNAAGGKRHTISGVALVECLAAFTGIVIPRLPPTYESQTKGKSEAEFTAKSHPDVVAKVDEIAAFFENPPAKKVRSAPMKLHLVFCVDKEREDMEIADRHFKLPQNFKWPAAHICRAEQVKLESLVVQYKAPFPRRVLPPNPKPKPGQPNSKP